MTKVTIETISANNAGGEKSEVYRLLNMVHVMAGRCAVAKIDGWELSETCTMDHYVKTVWTNGVVDITAQSYPNDGEHHYTLSQCKGRDNDRP